MSSDQSDMEYPDITIPSPESTKAFPQGVGGEAVDEYLAEHLPKRGTCPWCEGRGATFPTLKARALPAIPCKPCGGTGYRNG
jgi:hypothetical protein